MRKRKENQMNPPRLKLGSLPHLFSVSNCWTESSKPDPSPWLGHTRLGKYISSKIYTHVRNPGRVGLTPEHNMNQLFSCSRIFNQSIATTIRVREREKNGGVTVFLILRNRLKRWKQLVFCRQMLCIFQNLTKFNQALFTGSHNLRCPTLV